MRALLPYFKLPKTHFISLLLLASLFFWGNGNFDLFDNSETHYTRVAQEMAATQDYGNLYFNGAPWFVHPPLYFWTTTCITKLFGWSPFVLRFQEALFSLGTVFLTYFIGRLFFGQAIALIASLIYGSSFYIVIIGKLAIFDAHLYFFMLLSLYLILLTLHRPNVSQRVFILAGIATGLGILSKGPISLVQQLLFLGPYLLLIKRLNLLKSVWLWIGLGVSIIIPSPWYIAQLLEHGQPFFDIALKDYTWHRFFGVVENQSGPWYYYFFVLAAFFPWIAWLPNTLRYFFKQRPWQKQGLASSGLLFCWVAMISTFVFFSVAQTKLPNYIYLIFPFLSIVIAQWVFTQPSKKALLAPLTIFSILILIAGVTTTVYDVSASDQHLIRLTFLALTLPSFLFIASMFRRHAITTSFGIYCIGFFGTILWLTHVILPKVSTYDDIKTASNIILSVGAPLDTYEVVHYQGFKPSFMVRLNKNIHLINTPKAFASVRQSSNNVFILTNTDTLLELPLSINKHQSWTINKKTLLLLKHEH
jgi:4-amino-4-deoxy-L-arabinose transferase-like glycosyltransferase